LSFFEEEDDIPTGTFVFAGGMVVGTLIVIACCIVLPLVGIAYAIAKIVG